MSDHVVAPLIRHRETAMEMGATVTSQGTTFRVWAPAASSVEVEVIQNRGTQYHPLHPEGNGLYFGFVGGVASGARYRFRLDNAASYPDPYSRYQPDGVHGPSEVVDPSFDWHDGEWGGLTRDGLIIYECHVGTFTSEGTFESLIPQLRELKDIGVVALELMPVAEFPGGHNWGYDGVDLYAPSHVYGGPVGLKRLVDAAHAIGIGVILDVVYNHLGPDGNYLRAFSPDYFTDRHRTPWGDALNYDGRDSHWVREYAIQNACYWLSEYHLDGLRLDATHAIIDDSAIHLLAELAGRCRGAVAGERSVVILAENETNDVRLIRPLEAGGYGLDAVWADDFHHSLRVFLTGQREGYYEDYAGTTAEIARAIQDGFLYQGQPSPRSGKPRGTRVTDEPASAFVFCIQNHDQIGNRPFGERLNHVVSRDLYAVASALLLMVPETPMLFMGQEFAASSPFLYFTDHNEELGKLVTQGRREEFSYMTAFSDPRQRETVPDPQAAATLARSGVDLDERQSQRVVYSLYRDLLALRKSDPVLSRQDRAATRAVALGDHLVALHRWGDGGHRVVLANFGPEVALPFSDGAFLSSLPEGEWSPLFTTSARLYGGSGEQPVVRGSGGERELRVPATSAVVLALDESV